MSIKQRIEQYEIGGAVYTVIAEESENVKSTALDIILKTNLSATEASEKNIAKFIAIVKSYTEVIELTPEILNSFIDKIYIGKPERLDGKRVQEVKIIYKLIGAVDIPQ